MCGHQPYLNIWFQDILCLIIIQENSKLTPYIRSQVPSSSSLWQFSLASPSLSFSLCKMSGATATKFVWFGEGWDELKQHLAHKPCVKWHVLLLLPILSAFRVIQSPSAKTYNDEREAGQKERCGLQTPGKARLRSAQYHLRSAPFGAEARVKGSGWRQDVYGGRGAHEDWGKDSRKKWCLCWTLKDEEKAPAGVGKTKWTWHCQKLKPHFKATASDCFAGIFCLHFPGPI